MKSIVLALLFACIAYATYVEVYDCKDYCQGRSPLWWDYCECGPYFGSNNGTCYKKCVSNCLKKPNEDYEKCVAIVSGEFAVTNQLFKCCLKKTYWLNNNCQAECQANQIPGK